MRPRFHDKRDLLGEGKGTMRELILVNDEASLAAAFRQEIAILYKHSPYCWQSVRALREVQSFLRQCPEVPVYVVDVVTGRELSRRIATVCGVRHEFPQVILPRRGAVVASASHGGVAAGVLASAATQACA